MIPNCEQKSLKGSLSNYFLLSKTNTLAIPYLQMMFLQTKLCTFFSVMVAKALASIYPFGEVFYADYKELQLFH